MIDDAGICRGCIGQDLVTMEIRAFPADAVIAGHRRMRLDLRPLDDVDGLHRQRREPRFPRRRQIRQWRVHPGASHRDSRAPTSCV